MNMGTMLNAYPDSLGGHLKTIADFLEREECKDAFDSFYILPSLYDTDLDRGFSVISYELNRLLADPKSLARIKKLGIDLKLDFILNHLSVLSPQFQDILKNGRDSKYADFFIDWNQFWKDNGTMTDEGYIQPNEDAIKDMFLRKPGLPLLMVHMPDSSEVPYWNTFYQEVQYTMPDVQELIQKLDNIQYQQALFILKQLEIALKQRKTPEQANFGECEPLRPQILALMSSRRRYLGQMDLNLHSPLVWDFYKQTLALLRDYGASLIRLDAFAYADKAPNRTNFLNQPQTWNILQRIKELAEPMNLTLLPEIHASYGEKTYKQLSDMGYITYDFFLPGLIIDAIEWQDASRLVAWATELYEKKICTVNMLGCHDGIPLLDLKGMMPQARIEQLIDLIVSRGGLVKNLHGQKNVYYQVNATYYSALGEDDAKLLLARALQLFMPGKPQIWYLDLFAGCNDNAAVADGGAAGHKEINRSNLSVQEMDRRLKLPVVKNQLKLMRIRNTCPAFALDARFTLQQPQKHLISMRWEKDGHSAQLHADLNDLSFYIDVNGKRVYETTAFEATPIEVGG